MRDKTGLPAPAWCLNASEIPRKNKDAGYDELSKLVLLFFYLGSRKQRSSSGEPLSAMASVLHALAQISLFLLAMSPGDGSGRAGLVLGAIGEGAVRRVRRFSPSAF